MTSSRRHELPHDTYSGKLISRAKFDVCTPCSFGGKTQRQTNTHTHTHTDRKNCAL